MQEYEVIFYEDKNGNVPAKDFLDSLDLKMRSKMLLAINLLKVQGPFIRLPYSEKIDDDIFELRAKSGSNISRILYFFVIGKKIVLTNGFIKKTQATPKQELIKAKKYRADYYCRKGNNNER